MGKKITSDTEKLLKKRIEELEAENQKLKNEICQLKSANNIFYTLRNQLASSVDLGEPTEKLPTVIPEHKKWKADEYPEEWHAKEKVAEYLSVFWKNYPVSRSYFINVKGGQAFYKYLKRNNLLDMLPDSFQLKLKTSLKG